MKCNTDFEKGNFCMNIRDLDPLLNFHDLREAAEKKREKEGDRALMRLIEQWAETPWFRAEVVIRLAAKECDLGFLPHELSVSGLIQALGIRAKVRRDKAIKNLGTRDLAAYDYIKSSDFDVDDVFCRAYAVIRGGVADPRRPYRLRVELEEKHGYPPGFLRREGHFGLSTQKMQLSKYCLATASKITEDPTQYKRNFFN